MLLSQLRTSLKFYRSPRFIFRESSKYRNGFLDNSRLLSISAVKYKEEINTSELVDLIDKETITVETEIFTAGADSLLSTAPVDAPSLLEPTFSSLGLAHGYPSGWAQALMEVLHVSGDLTWVQTIGVTTILLRLFVLPIMISAQKAIVNQNKHLPVTQKLQVQAQLASIRGNLEESKFANQALNNYMVANNCHPFKTLLPIGFQACFFTSMFFGMRGMCSAPVESLTTGGVLWFPDLTLADPFCALPLLTASTIYLQLYFNADGMNTANTPELMKKVLYILPLISIPVMIQFPVALNLYWLTNNIISIVQARILKRPAVRQKLGIGEMTVWKPEDLPMTSFYEEMKREMSIQRSKQDKLEATKIREKKEFEQEESDRRKKYLSAFEEERKKQEAEAKK